MQRFLVISLLQVCAIYLWAYVYNIVRISLSISPYEVEVNASESSITGVGVSTEPLLRANDLARSERHSEQPALPSTRFDDKSQVDYASSHFIRAHSELTTSSISICLSYFHF